MYTHKYIALFMAFVILFSSLILPKFNHVYAAEQTIENFDDFMTWIGNTATSFLSDSVKNQFKSDNELTQNRKGHGKQVVYTTQTFAAVDNNFRNLTIRVVDCRTYFNRLTKCRHYRREFYEARTESKSIDKKIKLKPIHKETFIQTDFLRSRYDSFQRLDYIKKLNTDDLSPDNTKN